MLTKRKSLDWLTFGLDSSTWLTNSWPIRLRAKPILLFIRRESEESLVFNVASAYVRKASRADKTKGWEDWLVKLYLSFFSLCRVMLLNTRKTADEWSSWLDHLSVWVSYSYGYVLWYIQRKSGGLWLIETCPWLAPLLCVKELRGVRHGKLFLLRKPMAER